jgi:hypothetical protein
MSFNKQTPYAKFPIGSLYSAYSKTDIHHIGKG